MGVYENPRVALQVVDDSVNAKCDTLGGLVGFRGRAVLAGPRRGCGLMDVESAGRGCDMAHAGRDGRGHGLADAACAGCGLGLAG